MGYLSILIKIDSTVGRLIREREGKGMGRRQREERTQVTVSGQMKQVITTNPIDMKKII